MKTKSNNNETSLKACIIFICTIIIFLLQSLFNLIPIAIFDLDTNNLSNTTTALLYVFSGICTLIIMFLFYRKILINDLKELKEEEINKKKQNIIFTIKIWILNLIIMYGTMYIISLFGVTDSVNNSNVKDLIRCSPIIIGIYVVLIGPLIEEIMFRLSFKTIFKDMIPFILISGFVFGCLHALSINSLIDLLYLIPYCCSGFILAFIYYKTDNIYYSYSIHALHNFITLIIELITLMEVI